MNKNNIQYGGGPLNALLYLGTLIGKIAIAVGTAMMLLMKKLLKLCPAGSGPVVAEASDCFKSIKWPPSEWDVGLLWIYLKFCLKTIIYLIIFCFGGPIVILIGNIYLYSQLYVQLGRRNDDPDSDPTKAKPETNKNNDFQVHLIDGVTGSGKTELYLKAVESNLVRGNQSLILLPEIALTEEWSKRFFKYFGCKPFIWHSKQSKIQKARIARNPKTNETLNIPEKKTIQFRVSKNWTKKINEKE